MDSKKIFLIFLILIVVFSLGFYFNHRNKTALPLNDSSETDSAKPTEEVWKEYSSDKLKIKFEVPDDWNIKEYGTGLTLKSGIPNLKNSQVSEYLISIDMLLNKNNTDFKNFIFNQESYGEDRDNLYSMESINGLKIYQTDKQLSQSGALNTYITTDGFQYAHIYLYPFHINSDINLTNDDYILEKIKRISRSIQFIK